MDINGKSETKKTTRRKRRTKRERLDYIDNWRKEHQKTILLAFNMSKEDDIELYNDLRSEGSPLNKVREYYAAYKKSKN